MVTGGERHSGGTCMSYPAVTSSRTRNSGAMVPLCPAGVSGSNISGSRTDIFGSRSSTTSCPKPSAPSSASQYASTCPFNYPQAVRRQIPLIAAVLLPRNRL